MIKQIGFSNKLKYKNLCDYVKFYYGNVDKNSIFNDNLGDAENLIKKDLIDLFDSEFTRNNIAKCLYKHGRLYYNIGYLYYKFNNITPPKLTNNEVYIIANELMKYNSISIMNHFTYVDLDLDIYLNKFKAADIFLMLINIKHMT